MIFVRDMRLAFKDRGIDIAEFYLSSRNNPLVVFSELFKLWRMILSQRPAVVHAQYGGVTAFVAAMAVGRRPMVLSVRGSDLNRLRSVGSLRNGLTRLMTRLAALRSDVVICVSEQLRNQLWRCSAKAQVVPSGVNTKIFHPSSRFAARRSVGIPETTKLVLFNAGASPELKGLALIEEAMKRVRDRMPAASLHVLRGTTAQTEVATLMNAADCLVLASEAEGSPNIVKEAMACNLPVVATAVGDVMDRLAGVSPGAIVARNVEDLAEGVIGILTTGERSNGWQAVEAQGLSQDHVVDSLTRIYRSCARAGAERAPLNPFP